MKLFCSNPKTQSFSISRNSSPSSTSSSSPPSNRKAISHIEAAETLILKWNSETSDYAKVTSLFYDNRNEAIQYIHCVNQLQRAMHSLLKLDPSSQKLIHAQNLMQIAMKRLQKEFNQILSTNRAYLDFESISIRSSDTSFCSNDEGTTEDDEDLREAGDCSDVVDDLRIIADCMVSNGYTKECVNAYIPLRKSIVDESIYHKLNVEGRSFSKVNKMDWEVLEMKIKSWLEVVKISVKMLFARERNLCDRIFSSRSIREACFGEISRDGATLLFRFPELVARIKKSPPEKIFCVLDMYAAITMLLPEIDSIFSFNSTAAVISQAYVSRNRLIELAINILLNFRYAIMKDSSKSPANFCGVHSLTTRTMQYLTSLADYNNVLSEIFFDIPPSSSKSQSSDSYLYSPELSNNTTEIATGFSVRMTWLITVLLCKIDNKSEQCKNVSLSYLFLANNLRHVVEKVRESNLQYVLGDDWVLVHIVKVKQLIKNYERVTWGEVFSSLPGNSTTAISAAEARVVFMKFNLEFEKAYGKHNSIVVPEREFGEEIKESLVGKMIPIYRELYDTQRITAGMREYVNFTPEDIQNHLLNLFS